MMAAFYAWVSTGTATMAYSTIALQMVLYGAGMGLTSAPATEAIMGVVPRDKAGVGSAVNDTTRLLGGTLGVALIGSVYASLYGSRLTALLPHALPARLADTAHSSAGAALIVAQHLQRRRLRARGGPESRGERGILPRLQRRQPARCGSGRCWSPDGAPAHHRAQPLVVSIG